MTVPNADGERDKIFKSSSKAVHSDSTIDVSLLARCRFAAVLNLVDDIAESI